MKERGTSPGGPEVGFTLIELLVVLAVVGILAALLLPALIRGKAAAQSAACKSNLRQLGLALNLYVNDYDKYPGNAAMYSGGAFHGICGNGMNWLNPYLGGHFDPDSYVDWHYSFPSSPTVFNCPAVKSRCFPGFLGFGASTWYNLGYGYNELGTGWKDGTLRLGLGFTVQLSEWWVMSGAMGLPQGLRHYVTLGAVRDPSSLIAIGDSGGASWLTPNYTGYSRSSLTGLHPGRGANVGLCDGHVEFSNEQNWNAPSEKARARWNNDNQPHPETW